jgi:signal transduction histidine kinase
MAASDARSGVEMPLTAQVIMLRRLKVALIAAIVIPALLLIAGAWDERVQLLHAAEAEALATVTALRGHAFKAIETHELLVRELDSRIQGMSWDEIRASANPLSAEIRSMYVGMPEVSAMAITDAQGNSWAGTAWGETDGPISSAHREYWTAQRDMDRGTFISRAYTGLTTGRQNFGISRRRTTADGSFDGTVHISVAASYFSDFWAEVIAGRNNALVALVRQDGEVLARVPVMGVPVTGVPVTGEAMSGEAMSGEIGDLSQILRTSQADPRVDVFRTSTGQDGIERIYAYARVGNYPLVIVYGIPVASVVAPWQQHLLDLGGVGVLATASLVLAVLATIRQVHRLIAEQARRIALEKAAQQGQRMELLGQFTAGIAHDFANILQAIGNAGSLLRRVADQPERVRSLATRLGEDVERGTSLTRRMLDLVRPKPGPDGNPQSGANDLIDAAATMARVCEMLPRLLGRGYRLRCEMPHGPRVFVQGDRCALELAIMNLAVNARDAMPTGGEIVIRTTCERVGRTPDCVPGPPGLPPGSYVRISVADSGVGMSPEVLAQAGVLFFTTKPHGQGTGLGLAGARGFAERAGGTLCIESEQGRGTTVTLLLPAMAARQVSEPRSVERVG